ncbi:DUF1232 domain-containing protein [Arsenicitalea aurantiaca]|uniref:DUF1232 domain-containing protein n=2 Tax=Arsenicitalea aurantiaca TaxID=1783274 RepID=A0A433X5Z7_9HYPH|nr:DUF1232 domain-containing protein [Arsenicitalea aurantiaca]
MLLWRAFWAPATPFYLKAATLFAFLYLVSPVDLLPDVIPVLGWLDDIIIVPLIIGWIASRLPGAADPATRAAAAASAPRGDGHTIDGTARRL